MYDASVLGADAKKPSGRSTTTFAGNGFCYTRIRGSGGQQQQNNNHFVRRSSRGCLRHRQTRQRELCPVANPKQITYPRQPSTPLTKISNSLKTPSTAHHTAPLISLRC
jgi:hypothetical protein